MSICLFSHLSLVFVCCVCSVYVVLCVYCVCVCVVCVCAALASLRIEGGSDLDYRKMAFVVGKLTVDIKKTSVTPVAFDEL